MQITRIVKKKEDGNHEVTMMLTEEQTTFLINFALGLLVQQGTISFFDLDPDKPQEENQAAAFLERLNPKDMPQS